MPTEVVRDTNVKKIDDVRRITSEDAIAYRAKNCFVLTFQEIDEPIPDSDSDQELDTVEPTDNALRSLVKKYPAPPEWHDE